MAAAGPAATGPRPGVSGAAPGAREGEGYRQRGGHAQHPASGPPPRAGSDLGGDDRIIIVALPPSPHRAAGQVGSARVPSQWRLREYSRRIRRPRRPAGRAATVAA